MPTKAFETYAHCTLVLSLLSGLACSAETPAPAGGDGGSSQGGMAVTPGGGSTSVSGQATGGIPAGGAPGGAAAGTSSSSGSGGTSPVGGGGAGGGSGAGGSAGGSLSEPGYSDPPRDINVLLVSPGNLFLEKVLKSDPQVTLEVRTPDAYPGGISERPQDHCASASMAGYPTMRWRFTKRRSSQSLQCPYNCPPALQSCQPSSAPPSPVASSARLCHCARY